MNKIVGYDSQNKLYILRVKEKPGMVKIGDTHRSVAQRNEETMTNASLHRVGDVKFYKAVYANGEEFRDKPFHKFLTDRGWKRELNDQGNPSEWFFDITDEEIEKALKEFTGVDSMRLEITLRPWQDSALKNVMKANKKYNLLSLAARFGKTFLILELAQRLHDAGEKIVLVPASKSLSSNASFLDDYNVGAYNFKILAEDASLFLDTEKVITSLKEKIEEDEVLILVTDEADVASHTDISTEKLNEIDKEFNVKHFIAMSGTAIYKASKIFKDIPNDEIYTENITYTDLHEYEGEGADELVKRNFLNIRYDMEVMPSDDELGPLNIKQSFEQPAALPTMIDYVHTFVNDFARDMQFELQESNVVMVFVPGLQKKFVDNFVNLFDKKYGSTVHTIKVNGDEMTNRTAQQRVKTELIKMDKNGDTRKLMLFSSGMSQRSFSIPQIRRVVILSDNLINPAFIQMSSRCLTYDFSNKGTEQIGDIIRITTENLDIVSEVFMQEQPDLNEMSSVDKYKYGKRFLKNNTFAEYTFNLNDTNGLKKYNLSSVEELDNRIAELLDAALKIQDNVKYLVARFWNQHLNLSDVKASKVKSESIKSVKDTAADKPTKAGGKKEKNLSKDEERMLERYMSVTRCLPYIGIVNGSDLTSINELMDLEWNLFEKEFGFYKIAFQENLKNEDFKHHVESLFRAKEKYDDNELAEREKELFNLIGA